MSDENSVAPIERVNIKYKSKAEGGEEVEIPFKLLVTGDFSFGANTTPLAERKLIEINKDNFDEAMKAKKLAVTLDVKDEMSGVPDARLQAKLKFDTLRDMTPDGIIQQVPEMKRQLDLARALKEVKADLANPTKLAELRKRIDKVLEDQELKGRIEKLKGLR